MSAPADEAANLLETPAAASTTEAVAVPARFESRYLRDYFLDQAFDEMFLPNGELRPHFRLLLETYSGLPEEELARRKHSADMSFLTQGITFTVYGNQEGTERIFPYNMLRRIITGAEWDRIEKGLIQRITALNLFLGDIYSEGKILRDGFVPREIVYGCPHFRREMRELQVPRNVYIAVTGSRNLCPRLRPYSKSNRRSSNSELRSQCQ